MKNKMSGYLFGLIFSGVAAILIAVGAILYLRAELIRCAMSLGCTDSSPGTVLLLMLGGYLLIAAGLSAFASRLFHSRPGVGFLLNVAPLVAIVAALFLWTHYRDYAKSSNHTHALQNAISDAPAIHLGEPYVKMVDSESGGVTIFMHVPFIVDRTVQSQSVNILVTSPDSSSKVRYSSKPECNNGFGVPTYNFHIVDREFTEPAFPGSISGTMYVSKQLHAGVQYYLMRELHFGYSPCRVSDYRDFDPKQFNVTLDVPAAKQSLEEER
jgi:hypothetical protein